MSDFFNKQEKQEKPVAEPQAPETFKIGEKEYSQSDLSRLVGLGEKADELESKWDTRIDRLMPEYTKTTQELKAEREAKIGLEKKIAEYEAQNRPQEQIGREEAVRQAKEEAKALGLVTTDDLDNYYQQRRAGEQLHQETLTVIEEAKAKGHPEVDEVKLLQYMADNGIKNPRFAYKEMFEAEIDAWKEKQLKELKPSGFQSQAASTAGGKEPEEIVVTSQNLKQLLKETFSRGA